MNTRLILTLAVAASTSLCFAEKAADLKPTTTKAGKLIVDESFTASELAKTWNIAKGTWQVKDGELVGKEKAEDKHPAVAMLAQPIHNAIIRLSFKLDGTEAFSLSLNQQKGHLFRVNVTPTAISINKDKEKEKAAKGAKAPKAAKAAKGAKADLIATAEAKFENGKWYSLLLEMQGTNVALQTDNGVKITGSHAEIDVDKTGYRFVTKGASLVVDDIKVWEVVP